MVQQECVDAGRNKAVDRNPTMTMPERYGKPSCPGRRTDKQNMPPRMSRPSRLRRRRSQRRGITGKTDTNLRGFRFAKTISWNGLGLFVSVAILSKATGAFWQSVAQLVPLVCLCSMLYYGYDSLWDGFRSRGRLSLAATALRSLLWRVFAAVLIGVLVVMGGGTVGTGGFAALAHATLLTVLEGAHEALWDRWRVRRSYETVWTCRRATSVPTKDAGTRESRLRGSPVPPPGGDAIA